MNDNDERKRLLRKGKRERDKIIKEIAAETYDWAVAHGCYRETEETSPANYFTVVRGKCAEKPVWTEAFGFDRELWTEVQQALDRSENVHLCLTMMKGWFFGNPGEEGKRLASRLNSLVTAMHTIRGSLVANAWAGNMIDMEPVLLGSVKSYDGKSYVDILESVSTFLLSAGEPIQESFTEYDWRQGED